MGNDDGGGAVGQCLGEDFPRVNKGSINGADADDTTAANFVSAVEAETKEVFLIAVGPALEEGEDVTGGGDSSATG